MAQKSVKKGDLIKNPLKVGAISGIVLIVASFVIGFINSIIQNIYLEAAISLIVYVPAFLFLYAFYVLGKRYDKKFMRVMATIGIVLLIIMFLLSPILSTQLTSLAADVQSGFEDLGVREGASEDEFLSAFGLSENATEEEIAQAFTDNIVPFEKILSLIIWIVALIAVYSIFAILWGVALLGLKKVKYAKVAGILKIVGGASILLVVGLFFFGIGPILLLVAFIMEIGILFDESKKFKEK